ncbi:MAG: YihY/virulence factor BrkB family protein [Actinomycetota bacterium]
MFDRLKQTAGTGFELLKVAGKEYGKDRVARMSAAVAYRAIFALAPLFLLAVFVFGVFIGSNFEAQAQIFDAVERYAGAEVALAVNDVLSSVEDTGGAAGALGFVLLLWTASSLFMELQNSLDDIFHVPHERTTGVLAFIRKRGIGFLFALGLGLVLIGVWLLNFVWNFLGGLFPEDLAPIHRLIGVLAPVVSLVVLPLVIGLSFQVLSRVKVRWRAVWWGSFFTSVLFLVAAYGAGLYFERAGATAAGVAGSIFIILLLAFILSSVFLFGAEVTKVYDRYLGNGEVTRQSGRRTPPRSWWPNRTGRPPWPPSSPSSPGSS